MDFLEFKEKGIFPRINKDGTKSFRILVKFKDDFELQNKFIQLTFR